MAKFTPKERREHATAVGYHNAPVKADSKYTEAEQRAYNRGVADVMNEQAVAFMLGKNSPLSATEKAELRVKQATKRAEYAKQREKSAKKVGGKRK